MQKQKEQVMQPVSMAILIAIVFLSELPSLSARINSSFPPVIRGNRVSPLTAKTMHNKTDKDLPNDFVKIPVLGNVHPDGFYYVQIPIGTPPITYNLDIDSGSDLSWFPMPKEESRSMQYVRSDDARCRDVQESNKGEGEYDENSNRCNYKINYHDESSSEGLLVTDNFTLGSSIIPTLAIGASSEPTITHGMLGLGKGKISILSQLQEDHHFTNIFGHCLSSNPEVQGFMFIGKDFNYPSCFNWASMSSNFPFYSLTMAGVAYGDEQLLESNNQAFVLDSGTPNTYFVDSLYQWLLSKVEEVPMKKLLRKDGEQEQHCWKGTTASTSIDDLMSDFSSIYLRQDGKTFQIPPENYLITNEADGFVCLGILNGLDESLNDFNLIGAISMQNMMIAYDNEEQRIGWVRVANCSNPLASICG